MGAPPRTLDERIVREHMQELERLTATAGGEVVGALVQRLDSPSPQTLIGSGKVTELRHLAKERSADLVIFDDDLKPDQAKNLEQAIDVRVMDRSELILDIFASRARSREAKLQVELAQLEYLLPRLARMWTHLSRIRGGIGLRGPGETQIETDRRLIGKRISELKKRLKGVASQRATQRKRRHGHFRAALVGYTNAGKSSVLRGLSGDDLVVEDRLFATLDPATRQVDLGAGYAALVTDTVGFIRKLPHHLVASFRSTLEEAAEADVLLHVIDASHPDWEEQREVVNEVLAELGLDRGDRVLVFNKVDRITHAEEEALLARVRALETTPAVFVSALDPTTFGPLFETLKARLRARLAHVVVHISSSDGETVAEVYREAEVLARTDEDSTVSLTARVPAPLLGRLATRSGVRVEGVG